MRCRCKRVPQSRFASAPCGTQSAPCGTRNSIWNGDSYHLGAAGAAATGCSSVLSGSKKGEKA